jgi:excisionase family DNA binding protein
MTTQTENPRAFTVHGAAAYLSTSVKFIRALIWKRELQFTKAGKRFIIDRHELDRWLEANKVTA